MNNKKSFKGIIISFIIGISIALGSQYFNLLPSFGSTTEKVIRSESDIVLALDKIGEIEKTTSAIPSICKELEEHDGLIKMGIRQRTETNRKLNDYIKNQDTYMKLTDELKIDLKTTRDLTLQTKTKVDMIYDILKDK